MPGLRATDLDDRDFVVRADRSDREYATIITWRSERFQFDGALRLSRSWNGRVGEAAADDLVEYIDNLIGGTIRHFIACNFIEARRALHILEEGFHTAIGREMTRMEASGFRRFTVTDTIERPIVRMVEFGQGHVAYDFDCHTEEADAKALATLNGQLTKEQRHQLRERRYFKVRGRDGRHYEIHHARAFNVVREDGARFCVQTPDTPVADQMLAQKLYLENDPKSFFENANMLPARGDRSFAQADRDPHHRQRYF